MTALQQVTLDFRTMNQIKFLITNYDILSSLNSWEEEIPLESLKAYYLQRKILEAANVLDI